MNKTLEFEMMSIESYAEIYDVWNNSSGIGVSDADSKESIEMYLERNPNSSFVCYEENKIIGTILCGHDGRRGYIHHTCVLPEYRGRNIGKVPRWKKAIVKLREGETIEELGV